MQYLFHQTQVYTRRDIYRIIGISEDTRGGNWDTGYSRHGNAWFIFCNVGTSGRTGHDYANQWIGNQLEWYGKTNSKIHHPSIQSILNTDNETYIFWRESNQEPFIFAGIGIPKSIENTVPVKIIWMFDIGIFPDELNMISTLEEGSVNQVLVNAYERNPLARKKCIEYHGISCCVCGFNFSKVFGEIAEGFIHVHHLTPLSEIGKQHKVDPVKDLRPVCLNCHAMIHLGGKTRSIEEVKSIRRQCDRHFFESVL